MTWSKIFLYISLTMFEILFLSCSVGSYIKNHYILSFILGVVSFIYAIFTIHIIISDKNHP